MGERTAIEWTEATLNTWSGCTKVSAECAYCYIDRTPPLRKARRRFVRGHIPIVFHMERLEVPRRRRKPTMYFVNSISDTFHEDVPELAIAQLWAAMADCPQHTFQVLTKRPERMRELLRDPGFALQVELERRGGTGLLPPPWPLVNVWCGTSIGVRASIGRADLLRETPAAVRFVSAEPLLTPLVPFHGFRSARDRAHARGPEEWWPDGYEGPGLDLTGIDWLITGGESGSHLSRKPYRFLVTPTGRPRADRIEWVRDLRDACERAGTAFFFKQWGGMTPKSGGRELDGRTWDAMPSAPTRGALDGAAV
jgi:protein gp37